MTPAPCLCLACGAGRASARQSGRLIWGAHGKTPLRARAPGCGARAPDDGDELPRYSTAAQWRCGARARVWTIGGSSSSRCAFSSEFGLSRASSASGSRETFSPEGPSASSAVSSDASSVSRYCARIVARGFRVVGDLGLGESEQRCGMDVGRAGGFREDGGAGVLDALAWLDVQARSDSFDRRLGETREELLGRHIAKVSVGADGVAGDPGRGAAIAMAERAGEDIGERLARDDAQAFDVVAEAPALGDRLNEFCAGCMPGTVCLD